MMMKKQGYLMALGHLSCFSILLIRLKIEPAIPVG
jgi:hypothetical protein